jgi:hypothetical protein
LCVCLVSKLRRWVSFLNVTFARDDTREIGVDNLMTRTNLAIFQEALRIKQDELTQTRRLENIAIERSADELEEAAYKT